MGVYEENLHLLSDSNDISPQSLSKNVETIEVSLIGRETENLFALASETLNRVN